MDDDTSSIETETETTETIHPTPPPTETTTQVTTCSVCGKDLSHLKTNHHNIFLHEEKCKRKKKQEQQKKKVKRKSSIQSFFKVKVSKVVQVSESDEVVGEPSTSTLPEEMPEAEAEVLGEPSTLTLPEEVPEAEAGVLGEPSTCILEGMMEGVEEDVVKVSIGVGVRAQVCEGYRPALLGSLFDNVPFHLLKDCKDIVFSDEGFHHASCKHGQYLLNIDNDDTNVNQCCVDLHSHPKMKTWIENANDPVKYASTAHDHHLTIHQLQQRLDNYRKRYSAEKFKSLNTKRTLTRVHKALELQQRFIVLIKEHNIPKLHQLVKVASSRGRGLEYTINKMVDAIACTYNARSSEEDVDLAFLILQYGGPGLLDIVHRALNFPSTSTAYRLLQKTRKVINSSVTTDMEEFIHNIQIDDDDNLPSHGHMLKVDETYAEAKVRWNPRDNKLYGLCYEHARDEDLAFTSYQHVENLANMVQEGILHTPKESMVVVCSPNSPKGTTQVVAALPTCSKNEVEYQSNLIESISSSFKDTFGAPLLNWSTDGDPTRRKIFDMLMKHLLDENSPIFDIMTKLRLVDLKVGRNGETTNFDPKHLSKRIRTTLISGNFKIGDIIISQNDMKKILALVPNDTETSNASMMNPKDKQNVPLAVKTLLQFCKAVEDVSKLKTVSFKVASVSDELHLLKYVIDGILCTFVETKTDIKTQLQKTSLAAHVLFILKRELHTFLPNQLYHDLQATFEDAFFCAAKWKKYHPNLPLFLMLCSNDVLERFFGILRLKYRHCMIDNLEIIFATRAIEVCGHMMVKHPEWFHKNRNTMQRICLDYSNPRDWDHNKLVLENVDIVGAFNVGRAKAENELNVFQQYQGETCDFHQFAEDGYTFKIPYGHRKIGLNPEEVDLSLVNDNDTTDETGAVDDEEGDDNSEEEELEDVPSTSIIDMVEQNQDTHVTQKHDPQIEVDGSYMYKATIVKSLFSSNPLSKDRLRRVRGLTKYTENGNTNTENLSTSIDSVLMVGDPLLIRVKDKLQLCKIDLMKEANRKVKILQVGNLNKPNVTIHATILKVNDVGDSYIWEGELIGDAFQSSGVNCMAIQPDLKDMSGEIRFAFDKQLILDYEVAVTLEVTRQRNSAPSTPAGNSTSNTTTSSSANNKKKGNVVGCHVCKRQVDLLDMRLHVGIHILKGKTPENCCGFCGRDSCENVLVCSTKGKGSQYFKLVSNCEYYVGWKKTPQFSARTHCSNRLVHCTVCKASIWTYNSDNHYANRHPDFDAPSAITVEEIKKMKAKK